MGTNLLSPGDVPAHVPAELVHPYPFSFGAPPTENPFDSIIPGILDGPKVFYARNIFAGGTGGWVFTQGADLRQIYLDTSTFSSESNTPYAMSIGEDWRLVPSEVDPPEHGRYRIMINSMFVPKVIGKLADRIRQYAREQIEELRPRGEADLFKEFTQVFPVRVFLELMGLPQSMLREFLDWGNGMMHPQSEQMLSKFAGVTASYLREQIADRRTNPKDDLITYGVNAEISGRHMSEDDVLGFCFGLFLGGIDTVSASLALQLVHLARNPEDQTLLRNNPELIPNAVDEFMRAYAPATTFRTCKKQTEIRGITIMPGDLIVLCTSLAGRDPNEFDRPNDIIFDRKSRHIGFAYGPHACVGAHLARLEMRTALEEVLSILPQFHLDPQSEILYTAHLVIQPNHIPARWSV